MKKLILTIISLLTVFTFINAQDPEMDSPRVKNKMRFKGVFPKADNYKHGEKAGDLYFNDVYGAFQYFNGTKTVMYSALKTIEITSANILAGDSILIINPHNTTTKILPISISTVFNAGSTPYTTTATDSSMIYTYYNGVPSPVVYIADTLFKNTIPTVSSVSMDENNTDIGVPYWISLKNYNDGNGTLTIYFYYVKFE